MPRARPGLPGGAARGLVVILRCSSGEWNLRARGTLRDHQGALKGHSRGNQGGDPEGQSMGGHVRDLEQSEHLDGLAP